MSRKARKNITEDKPPMEGRGSAEAQWEKQCQGKETKKPDGSKNGVLEASLA